MISIHDDVEALIKVEQDVESFTPEDYLTPTPYSPYNNQDEIIIKIEEEDTEVATEREETLSAKGKSRASLVETINKLRESKNLGQSDNETTKKSEIDQIKETESQDPTLSESCNTFDIHGKTLSHENELPTDISMLSEEKPYKCDICDKTFTQLIGLKRHTNIHTGFKPFECPTCKQKFTRKCNLKRHIEREQKRHSKKHGTREVKDVHKEDKSPQSEIFQCGSCHKSFSSGKHLVDHLNNCESASLKKAEETESENTESTSTTLDSCYICEFCNETFQEEVQLQVHVLRHTGGKPYKSNSRQRKVKKLYQCNICQESFNKLLGLKSHFRIHTGEKPYRCGVCGERFTENKEIKDHDCANIG